VNDHEAIAKYLRELGMIELAFSVDMLGKRQSDLQRENARQRLTLDEIAANSQEDEMLAAVSRIPHRRRFVPTVVIGGRA
jgi:hypothetical protein